LYQNNQRLTAFCIGAGLVRTICFQWLDAGVMVMTMVDFGKLQLKRSIHPVTYAFMFYSLTSVHMADHEDSYDYYDAILCTGPYQLRLTLLIDWLDRQAQVFNQRSAHQDLPGTLLQVATVHMR
jgi:hypothetical protein